MSLYVTSYFSFIFFYSASKTLATFDDPRALYVKWYRAGQESIMTEAIEALSEAIDGCES